MNAVKKLTFENNDSQLLENVGLFQDIADQPDALAYIANLLDVECFEKGQEVITIGKNLGRLYILTHGKVDVVKTSPSGDRFAVATISHERSPFFGELGLLDDAPHSTAILAAEDSQCYVLHRKAFDALCSEHPEWGLPILRQMSLIMSQRLRKTTSDFLFMYSAFVDEIRGRG